MANYDIFDENYYLTKYPFVQEGIDRGIISSGKEHFQKFGQKLGLTEVSRYYDESYYAVGVIPVNCRNCLLK